MNSWVNRSMTAAKLLKRKRRTAQHRKCTTEHLLNRPGERQRHLVPASRRSQWRSFSDEPPLPRRVRVPATTTSWVAAAAGLNTSRAALTRLERPQMRRTQSRITPCRLHSREPALFYERRPWGQQQQPCTTTTVLCCSELSAHSKQAVGRWRRPSRGAPR